MTTFAHAATAEDAALVHSLAPLAQSKRLAHIEMAVLRVVRELTGAPAASFATATPLIQKSL